MELELVQYWMVWSSPTDMSSHG